MRNLTSPAIKKSGISISRGKLYLAIAAASQLLGVGHVYAGPEGGQVVGGAGSIDQSGLHTTINQHTDRMAIDWQSFNVASDERVQFIQPSSSSIALNRVLSHSGSEIHGRIEANGQVILVNPNGVFFGENSHINVGGMIASGLQINPNDFMNGEFTLTSVEGTAGKVVNSGIIHAAIGGSVTLVGQQVQNDGLISAKLGAVNLAAGKEAVVTFDASGLVGIKVTKEILQDELGIDAALINNGEINAEGGRILLSANASQDIFSEAVNHGDLGQAKSVVFHDDGSFTLGGGADVVNTGHLNVSSDSGDAGQVVVLAENLTSSGEISANSVVGSAGYIELHARDTALLTERSITSAVAENSAVGGQVKLLGRHVGLFDQSRVDASGALGGGEVLIGGDFQGKNSSIRNAQRTFVAEDASIYADALTAGDGGKIIVWADDITRYYGSIYSRSLIGKGGFAEISGKNYLSFDGSADLTGFTDLGRLLLDPENITIDFNAGQEDLAGTGFDDAGLNLVIRNLAIIEALESANVTLEATNTITVNGAISTDSENQNSLTFMAGNSIAINANIDLGEGDLIFNAGVASCGTVLLCSGVGSRSFTLFNLSNLDTLGAISINSADNILIEGFIGNSRAPESVVIKAGNNITLASTSSITAGLNADNSLPTIHLAAGDNSLFSSRELAERSVPLTGNLVVSGELTTGGGSIYLAADGGINTAATGLVTIQATMVTGGGDFTVVNSGNFINGDNVLSTHSNLGGGDISITSGGNIELGSVDFGYTVNASPTVRSGSVTAVAGGNFTLTHDLDFNDSGPRRSTGVSHGHSDQTFLSFSARGNVTIDGRISDRIGDPRDALNITLAADTDGTGGGNVVINRDIYTSGGNYTASGFQFNSANQHINTDFANSNDAATFSLGGNVSISATESITLGSITTDANCTPSNNCTGNLTISRRSAPPSALQMDVTQGSGELTIRGRTTIDVGTLGNVTFTDDDNRFTGGFVLASARDVSITDAEGDIMLNGVNVSNALTLRAINGGISQENGSDILVNGATILTAEGTNNSIILNQLNDNVSRNNFVGTVSASAAGGAITLGDMDSFLLGVISSGGGDITLNSNLRLNAGRAIDAGNGDVNIAGTINSSAVGVFHTLTINAEDVVLGGNIGDTNRLGAITLNADGNVTAASINANSLTANNVESFTSGDINTSRANSAGGNINITSSGNVTLGSLNTQGIGNTGLDGLRGGDITLSGNAVSVSSIDTSGFNAVFIPGIPGTPGTPGNPSDPSDPGIPGTPGTPAQQGVRGAGGAVTITGNGDTPIISLGGDINTRHGTGLVSGAPSGDELTQGLVSVNLSQVGTVNLDHSNFLTSNITVNGNGQDYTLRGFNHGGTWSTTAENIGRINGTAGSGVVTFNNFANLDGGSGIDTFNLNHNVTGRVRGGDGDDVFNIRVTVGGDIEGQGGSDRFVIATTNAITVSLFGGDNSESGDTIIGATRSNEWAFTPTGGTLNNTVTFAGIENVIGGDLDDTFSGVDAFDTGSIRGGDGIDTVNVAGDITVDFSSNPDSIFRGVTEAEIIRSSTGGRLTVNSSVDDIIIWDIFDFNNPANATTDKGEVSFGAQNIKFDNFASLLGGAGNDTFNFFSNSRITGSIDGGVGTNRVSISDLSNTNAYQIELGNSRNEATLNLLNIGRVVGNNHADSELWVAQGNNTWTITDFDTPAQTLSDGVDDGTVTSSTFTGVVEFVNFRNLIGGSGNDLFTFASESSGRITGRIDGGSGQSNQITGRNTANTWIISSDNAGSITAGANYLNAFSNIQTLQGGDAVDIFSINANFDGWILGGGDSDQFNFGNAGGAGRVDGQAGDNDTLRGRNARNTWNLNDQEVASNGETYIRDFLNMDTLQGGAGEDTFEINRAFTGLIHGGDGDDFFVVRNNGSATLIDGGNQGAADVLDLTNISDSNSLNVAVGSSATADINIINIERANARNSANHTLIADNTTANTWVVNGRNQGRLNGVLEFTNFANLVGREVADEFVFTESAATITGVIDGGNGTGVDVLTLTGIGRDSRVRVTESTNDIANNSINILNIETVNASTTHNNFFVASNRDNDWQITDVNRGTLNRSDAAVGIEFIGFQNAVGGNQDDTFTFQAAGNLTGNVDGGAHLVEDIVDKSRVAMVDVRLADVGEGYTNIERFIGNNSNSVLRGDNNNNEWVFGAGQNIVTINNSMIFEGFNTLIAGDGNDTFRINQGLLTGSIQGGGGNDRFLVNGGTVQGQIFGDAGNDILTANISPGTSGAINFVGGGDTDEVTVTGGNDSYDVLHDSATSGGGSLRYADAAGNTYTVAYTTVNRINDNLQATLLTVNGTAGQDNFVLSNNRYRLNDFTEINYTNKNNLTIAAVADDQVVIDGIVNIARQLTVRNAAVTATATGQIVANSLRLNGTAEVGSAADRLDVNVNSLYVTAANGAIYLQEQNALDIAELSSTGLVDIRLGGNLTSSTPLIFSRDFIASTTGGDIVLTGANQFTGNLSLSSNGLVELHNTSATNLNEVRAQDLIVDSGGLINGTGIINVNGLAQFASDGNIVLSNQENNFNSVRIDSANNVSLTNSDLLALTGVNANGRVEVNSAALAVNGVIDVGELALQINNDISLGSAITADSGVLINAGGSVTQQANLTNNAGAIAINANGFSMNSGTSLTANAGTIGVNSSGSLSTQAINAAGDINLQATSGIQVNDQINSTAGSINIASGNNLMLSGNLTGNAGIALQSLNGNIQQQSQLQSQQGDISVIAAGDIVMGTNAVTRAQVGDISYTGANISMTSFIASAGTVALNAMNGSISDSNGNAVNVTANRFVADAATGIGGGDAIETLVNELSLSNNTGIINIENGSELTVNRLHANGDVILNNLVGDVTLDNTSGTLYSQAETDARLAGGTANANYNIGSLTINVSAGNLLATGAPNIQNPDIVARTAVLTTPAGSLGSPDRMLVIYVRDYLFIGGVRSWGPFWGFDTKPLDVDNQATIQGNLSDLLAAGNEQLVAVETLDEVDPAVFTSVRNYFYDDIAIMLPRDQYYYSDDDEQ